MHPKHSFASMICCSMFSIIWFYSVMAITMPFCHSSCRLLYNLSQRFWTQMFAPTTFLSGGMPIALLTSRTMVLHDCSSELGSCLIFWMTECHEFTSRLQEDFQF